MYGIDLQQPVRIARDMGAGADERPDQFFDRSSNVDVATNLEAKSATLAYLKALAFQNGLEHRNDDVKN